MRSLKRSGTDVASDGLGIGAAASDLDWRVRSFVYACRARLGAAWHPESAAALYPVLDRLSEDAQDENRDDLAAAALDLAVYVSAFIDGGAIPAPRQCVEIGRLLGDLGRAAGIAVDAGGAAAMPGIVTELRSPSDSPGATEATTSVNCR